MARAPREEWGELVWPKEDTQIEAVDPFIARISVFFFFIMVFLWAVIISTQLNEGIILVALLSGLLIKEFINIPRGQVIVTTRGMLVPRSIKDRVLREPVFFDFNRIDKITSSHCFFHDKSSWDMSGMMLKLIDGGKYVFSTHVRVVNQLIALKPYLEQNPDRLSIKDKYRMDEIDISREAFLEGQKHLRRTYYEDTMAHVKYLAIFSAVGLSLYVVVTLAYFSREHLFDIRNTMLVIMAIFFTPMVVAILMEKTWLCQKETEKARVLHAINVKGDRSGIPKESLELFDSYILREKDERKPRSRFITLLKDGDLSGIKCGSCGKIFEGWIEIYPAQERVRVYCPYCREEVIWELEPDFVKDVHARKIEDEEYIEDHYDAIVARSKAKGLHLKLAPGTWWKKGTSMFSPGECDKVAKGAFIGKYQIHLIFISLVVLLSIILIPAIVFGMEESTVQVALAIIAGAVFLGIYFITESKYTEFPNLYQILRSYEILYDVTLANQKLGYQMDEKHIEKVLRSKRERRTKASIKEQLDRKGIAVIALDGEDYVAYKLIKGQTVEAKGMAGGALGCFNQGGSIQIHGDVTYSAGSNMCDGELLVYGNVTDIYLGIYMLGGTIIVTGDAGNDVGYWMTGGRILVGGHIEGLGPNAVKAPLDGEDLATLADAGVEAERARRFTKIVAGKVQKLEDLPPEVRELIEAPPDEPAVKDE